MTFDTFDTYNTDEAYNDKGTTAKGLVAAYKKDNPEGTADDFYAKLNNTWKEDKNGYVKKAVDEAFKAKEETPMSEEPEETTEEAIAEKVLEESEPEETKKKLPESNIKQKDKNFLDKTNTIADEVEKQELEKLEDRKKYNQAALYDEMVNAKESFKRIDDHMVEQLPTFFFRRYQNGEFGEPGSKDAKLRLAHFMLNGVQTALRRFSNGAALAAGKSPMYANEMSDYEKYQMNNLTKGMENRWKKYEADTNNAIEMASKESMSAQDARLAAEQITRNKRLDTGWNMMNEKQKVYEMEVIKEIGDNIGNMDLNEVADFLTGAAVKGNLTKEEAAAVAIAQLAKKTPELLKNLPEGKTKDIVIQMLGGGDIQTIVAGLGGALGGKDETPENPDSIIDEKKTNNKMKNPTGNLKGYKALDGNTYDFNTFESKAGKEKLINLINDLSTRFYNGEIDAETFRKHYNTLSGEAGKHWGIKVEDTEKNLKKNVNLKLKDLNAKAKDGKVTVDDYKAETAKILDMANDVGMTEKEIEKLKKDFKKESSIKYKGPSK